MHNNKAPQGVVLLKSAPNWRADFSRDALRECCVLCVGGFDPSGGAGILADARMLNALGGHACALVTLNTSQGRSSWRSASAQSVDLLREQWQGLADSLPIHAIKIGAVANAEQIAWLIELITDLKVPVVLDPVLTSSSGGHLSAAQDLMALLDHCTVITPNRAEAEALLGPTDPHDAPCAVLITGSDAAQQAGQTTAHHQLYAQGQLSRWESPVLPGRYRGSGCMLASAIAGFLGRGLTLENALDRGLAAVQPMLKHAWRFEDGVHLPRAPQ